jgi:hypothetical protein
MSERRVKSLKCNFTGEPCYNPNCKVGLCIEERRAKLHAQAGQTELVDHDLERELPRVAKQVAKERFRKKRIVATPEKVAKAMKHPSVLAEAKRRIEAVREIASPKKSHN